MKIKEIKEIIEKILDDNKAQNITSINLKNKSHIADYMIIALAHHHDIYRLYRKF